MGLWDYSIKQSRNINIFVFASIIILYVLSLTARVGAYSMNGLDLRGELTTLLEKEVGFTGKFILQKQCQHLDIDPDHISPDNLPLLSSQIHWAIRSFTGDRKADEIKKGIMRYKEALDIAMDQDDNKVIEDPLTAIEAQITIGASKVILGKHEESLEALQNAIRLYEDSDLEDTELEARLKRKMGATLSLTKAGREEAIVLYEEVISAGPTTAGPYNVAQAWNGMGVISWRRGDHKLSLDHYMSAIIVIDTMPIASKKEKKRKKEMMARIHSGLGNTCLDMMNMEMSIHHNEKAIELYTQLGEPGGIGMVNNNLARVYEEMGEYSKAIDRYRSGIKYCNESGSLRMEGWTMTNLASTLIENRRADDAKHYLDKASRILGNFTDPVAHSKLHCMYGKYHSALGQFRESEEHFQKSIEYVVNENSPDYLAIAQEEMGKMYHACGEKKRSREALNAALEWYEVKGENERIKKINDILQKMDD